MAVRNALLPLTLTLPCIALWMVAVAGVLSGLVLSCLRAKKEKNQPQEKAFSPHGFHTVMSLAGMTPRC